MADNDEQVTGRRHRSRAEAEELVAEFEAGTLTRLAFCERRGISLSTLARYLGRYRVKKAQRGAGQAWVALEIADRLPAAAKLTVVLPRGRRIEVGSGFDVATLQRLVSALDRLS